MGDSQITEEEQFILGAFIVIGVGLLAFLDQIRSTQYFTAILAGYGVTGIAYGVYLMSNSTAISNYWKYVVIILVSVIGYGLANWTNQLAGYGTAVNPVLIAAFVTTVANFALNDLQEWKPYIPTSVVNNITIIIGGTTVVAAAVQNAPAGSIISIPTLLAVIVPVLMVYLFQMIPWPQPTPGPSPAPTPPAPAGAVSK